MGTLKFSQFELFLALTREECYYFLKEVSIACANVYIIYLYPNRDALLETTPLLQLNPAIPGVFGGPYPFGIDPVRALPSYAVLYEHLV